MRHIGVRDEYAPTFGRQNLTLWSPPFASVYEGSAHELPGHNGFMVQMQYGPKFKVECESPRDDANWMRVDDAIVAGVKEAERRECAACGNDVWNRFVVDDMYWREENWGDERDIQCGLSEDGRHHPKED